MTTTSNNVEKILEFASRWQLDEAMRLVNTLNSGQMADDKILRASCQLVQAISAMQAGHYEVGVLDSLPAMTKLVQHGYRPFLDWAYSSVGLSFGMLGTPETGLEWVTRAIIGAGQRSDQAQLRRSLNDEGRLFAMLDDQEKSVASFEKTLALADSAPAIVEEAQLLNHIADTYLHFAQKIEQTADKRTDLAQKAMHLAQSTLELLERQNQDSLTAWSLANLGNALTVLGKFPEAEAAFVRALALSESDARIHVESLASYALLLCKLERYAESDALLQHAFDQAQPSAQGTALDRIFEARVQLAILTGNNTDALIWSERRFYLLENRYRQRLASMTRNSEIFVELEKARLAEQKAQARADELKAVNTILENQSKLWEDQALRDALTGCLNQHGLTLFATEWFVPGKRAAVAMVDIDGFKSIVDKFGHNVGDEVVRAVAMIFIEALRGSDIVARLVNDEFLLVIQGVESAAAWGTCERLRRAVENHGWENIAPNLRVTVSIGLVVRSNDEMLEALSPNANTALQQARANGRNKVISGV